MEPGFILGMVPAGEKVRELLDQADLFVLPSKTEGLPRAVLEAMARGLPCVCTSVGGVPEVLSREDLVPPGDAVALARKINDVLTNPERMASMSIRNLKKVKEYCVEILRGKRIDFYSVLKEHSGKD